MKHLEPVTLELEKPCRWLSARTVALVLVMAAIFFLAMFFGDVPA